MIRLNSKLSRKPPPPIIEEPQFSEELDFKKFDIDSYLSKSPIISSFRQQNPNLQPTSDDSDFDMYSSLDPSIKSVPPSPAVSQASFITANDYSPVNSPFPTMGSSGGNGSVTGNVMTGGNVMNSGNGTVSNIQEGLGISKWQDGKFSTTAPLDPIVVNVPNKKFKDRFKRLSLNNYGSKKFIPGHKKFPSEGGKRLSILPNRQRSDSYQSITSDCDDDIVNTPYWKYHILRFGKDLYLTTNPSLKHMYCRNGPGYYIEITNGKTIDDGFTMVFKDAANQSDRSIPPIMIIHKKGVKEGGHLTISLTKQNQLKKNIIKNDKKSDNTKIFNGLSIPQAIPEQFIPYDKISNNKFFEKNEINFQNYEMRDFNNAKWNIGSIPRVRISRLNKFKNNLDKSKTSSLKNSSSSFSLQSVTSIQSNQSSEESFKFIGQKNIYFHQNYLDSNVPLPYKLNSANAEDTYLQVDDTSFPPVLGLFRPYEKKLTKKLVNSINKRLSRSFDKDLSIVDLNNFNKFKNNLVNNDLAGGSIKNYFIAGDGLYYNQNPLDDLPDDNKLGWLTIYEDKMLQDKGMFDLVLGILTAVGYESYLKGLK